MKKVLSVLLVLMMLMGTLLISPLSVSAADGWDGTTATKPSGDGTKESPYLISSAENLLWMSRNIKKGDQVGDADAGDDYGPSFEGQYFLQTCDIDLNGKVLPSIGFYYANDKRMGAFGGTYDGCGFSIKNGNIKSYNSGHALNVNWGHGLFGTIYGATIRNVVLEGLAIEGHGVTGAVVGRAVASTAVEQNSNFNLVENCVVKSTCSITAKFPNDTPPTGKDAAAYDQASRVGGIVGMAYGTTVKNCTNAANIAVPGNFNFAGGIVGTAGFGVVVDHCINTGNITLDTSSNAVAAESAYGGIVGFITPYGPGSTTIVGDVTISNCYNTGSFTFAGTAGPGNATYWGGVLGGANSLKPGSNNKISNCYNLNGENTLQASNGNFRIGGLLGSYWIGKNANVAPIYMDNAYSVTLTKGGNTSSYEGTNEYRCWIRQNSAGKVCIQIGIGDGQYADAQNGAYPANATVGTKTADEIKLLTAKIDTAVERVQTLGKSTYILGVQKAIDDNTKVRIVAGINTLDALNYGFEASVQIGEDTPKTAEPKTSTTVYTALLADNKTISVADYDVNYFACVTLTGIPASGTVKYTVKSFVTKIEGVRIYGDTIELTFVDGVLSGEPVIVQ